ncbi:MAG: urease accessory protein UreD [Candidatus Competibacteraceae bacterium]|nr:urease accessory protein UreD [Candidatus Competibacteraceae bacterium]MBK8896412.1 urease accessory protein UreD [Candidatus Competibacteraceae bacterium]MBK8964167.1 urease accessory protein UreD [Candidatus Competibacteraceae bacterium]MBK9952714.1 urease accessory protein UreD [Candidatus Competibacteraceae bacterium]
MSAGLAPALTSSGWQAALDLRFQRAGRRTVLARCAHQGPLRVQRPFHPEGDRVCHVALLHPPGGVVGGDGLHIQVALDSDAHALITTPAAGKFYRSAGPWADQTQRLTVAADAVVEWLPQETIVYDGARVRTLTRVELHGNAGFIGWDIVCLGRPAAGERFQAGDFHQDFELWRDGEPLYWERGRYAGGDSALDASWGLQGQPAFATLIGAGAPAGVVEAIRAGWTALQARSPEGELVAISQLDGVLIGRYLGPSAVRARQFLILAWSLLRPMLLQRPPCPSRFWAT